MSSYIRLEGPGGYHQAQPHPQNHPQHQHHFQHHPQQQQLYYSHTMPAKPHRSQPQQPHHHHNHPQQVYVTRPPVPSYQQAYTMRPAPTNLSKPSPPMAMSQPQLTMPMGQPSMAMSMGQQQNYSTLPMGAKQQKSGPVYAMPLNASSQLNIQLMLQGGLQNLKLGGQTENGSGPHASAPTLQRQQSESSTTSSAGAGSANIISTQAEVYNLPISAPQSPTSTETTSSGLEDGEIIITSPTPSSTSSTMSTQTEQPPSEPIRDTRSPPPPPVVPTQPLARQESETDSARGSLPEGGSQEDTRSLQSYSSGGGRSDLSWDLLPSGAEASNFEFGEGEDAAPQVLKPCRVGMAVTPGAALMIKMVFDKDEIGDEEKVLDILADITDKCWENIQKQARDEMVNLNATQLGKLKLKDGRACKEHVAELASSLGEAMELSEGVFRRYEEVTQCHVANYMYEIVKTRGSCTLGKTGVVICVRKKNKYAPVDAFCEQLCEHIAVTKPRWVGKLDLAKINKRNPAHLQSMAELSRRGFLLPQTFLFDPTITVAEAAKRSFVEVIDFVYYH